MLFGGGGLRGGRKEGGGGLLVGLFMVMERPAEEKVDGWKGEGRKGTGGLTIREKFRPVKVSFLPIVLLIKTAPAPELIEGLSLSLTPLPLPPSSVLLAHPADSLCGGEKEKRIRKKKKAKGTISAPSWCYHQPATAQQLISLQLLLKGQGWDRTIMNTSSLPQQRN